MNLLTMENLTKVFTERRVFDHTDFSVNEGEKIGIIGVNGTGKSTLLRVIAGLEEPDEGTVTKGRNVVIRYLPQKPDLPEESTVLEAVMAGNQDSLDTWGMESQAKAMLLKLDITDFSQSVKELSGGQKKRAALVKVLLQKSELLLLDEPTNHLDGEMSQWLEDYLIGYKGALVMVTHDRYFLDRVSNRIAELDDGKIYNYPGSYSEFIRLKEARQDLAVAAERKRQSVLRKELEWLSRGARARSTKQKAHIDRIEQMQQVTGPKEETSISMTSVSTRMGKKTIEASHLSKSYGSRVLFSDYSYIFLKGDRIGITGPNGCGKSTLLKILTGNLEPDEGTMEWGPTVKIGYFSQEGEELDDSMKVIDYIKEAGEYVTTTEGVITASAMLERFLFDGPMQWNPIGKLSGGEKRRLFLLKILMTAPNVLVLDEPTNDLDIKTLTILEDYLDNFDGIVVTVSHDRYFLDRIVRRIFAFEEGGKIRQYEGGYSDYRLAAGLDEKQAGLGKESFKAEKTEKSEKTVKPKERKLRFSYKEEREYAVIDDEIEKLESRLSAIETETEKSASDYPKLKALMEEKEAIEKELEEKMERWEYLNELAEQIQRERTGA